MIKVSIVLSFRIVVGFGSWPSVKKIFFSSFIKWAKDEMIVSGRVEGTLLGAPGTQELFIFTPVGSNSSNSVC